MSRKNIKPDFQFYFKKIEAQAKKWFSYKKSVVQKQFFNLLIYLTCGSIKIYFLVHKKHTPEYA